MPKGASSRLRVSACCWASSSVGASSAPLIPCAHGGPEGGRGHQGLAAAHVPLQQAVHRAGPGHVLQDLVHRTALGPGGRKGQAGPEGGGVGPAHGRAGGGGTPVFQQAHPQLQHQQFLKDQAAARLLGGLGRGRGMDVPHGLGLGGQAVFLQQGRGQRVPQQLGVGQQLGHAPADGAAVQSVGLGIDRDERHGRYLCGGADLGVDHLAAQQSAGHHPLKIVFLADLQLLDGVGIIEPGQFEGGHVVPGRGLFHPASPCGVAAPLLCQQLGPDHALHPDRGFGRGVGVGEIQIAPRIVLQKVGQGADAQLLEPLGQLGPHSLEVLYGGVRGQGGSVFGFWHRHASFRGLL